MTITITETLDSAVRARQYWSNQYFEMVDRIEKDLNPRIKRQLVEIQAFDTRNNELIEANDGLEDKLTASRTQVKNLQIRIGELEHQGRIDRTRRDNVIRAAGGIIPW